MNTIFFCPGGQALCYSSFMSVSELVSHFNEKMVKRYPSMARYPNAAVPPNHLSPHSVDLRSEHYNQAQEFVFAINELCCNKLYTEWLRKEYSPFDFYDPGNRSVLMGYDFHIDPSQNLRLVEINTNAAFSLILELLYETQGLASPGAENFSLSLKKSFQEEVRLSGKENIRTAAIVDEKIQSQGYFIEFLMFQNLFNTWGWETLLGAPEDFVFKGGQLLHHSGLAIDLVYNRLTDFLLARYPDLNQAYHEKAICLTPNPHEYAIIADKERLTLLSDYDLLSQFGLSSHSIQVIQKVVPKTQTVKSIVDKESLWRERKRYFFKPTQSFGGKQAYRGAKLTRSVFEEILTSDFVAQEYAPPAEITIPNSPDPLKYDLRFYAYTNQIQLVGARTYRGQVTNFRDPDGGFAVVKIL